MAKKIIICADGTWNTSDATDQGRPCPTNVTKVARSLRPTDGEGTPQIVYYHSGVGTNFGQRLAGGAFGVGLFENVRDCYRFIVHNYQIGDRLYFFGFSRGAFTVRSLAGLIRNSGILKRGHEEKESAAIALYRDYSSETAPDSSNRFRAEHSYQPDPEITFVGVWDTVGALGIPGLTGRLRLPGGIDWQFHDVTLSHQIRHARHALSVHEHRKEFQPTLWELQPADPATPQTLKQVWFLGVHSDVGGGYPQAGLSDIALDWMVAEASAPDVDLAFAPELRASLNPQPLVIEHDSFSVFYKILDFIEGKGGGELRVFGENPNLTNQNLHDSVVKRYVARGRQERWPASFEQELKRRAQQIVTDPASPP